MQKDALGGPLFFKMILLQGQMFHVSPLGRVTLTITLSECLDSTARPHLGCVIEQQDFLSFLGQMKPLLSDQALFAFLKCLKIINHHQ